MDLDHGQHCVWPESGPKLFINVSSRQQNVSLLVLFYDQALSESLLSCSLLFN